jgi:hypothetical protein
MAAAGGCWRLYIGPHATCLSPFWNAQFAATASMVSALASQFLDKEKAALVRALSYHHRLDVAYLRSAVGREVGAPFCIPLRPGGASAPLIADSP